MRSFQTVKRTGWERQRRRRNYVRVTGEGLSGEEAMGLSPDDKEGVGVKGPGWRVPGRRNSMCKGPEAGMLLVYSRRPEWLKQIEQEEEQRARSQRTLEARARRN